MLVKFEICVRMHNVQYSVALFYYPQHLNYCFGCFSICSCKWTKKKCFFSDVVCNEYNTVSVSLSILWWWCLICDLLLFYEFCAQLNSYCFHNRNKIQWKQNLFSVEQIKSSIQNSSRAHFHCLTCSSVISVYSYVLFDRKI